MIVIVIECSRCHGSGEVHDNPSPIRDPQCAIEGPCPDCHGSGVAPEPDEIEADVRPVVPFAPCPVGPADFAVGDGADVDRPF